MEVKLLADDQYKIKSYKIQRQYYKTNKYTLIPLKLYFKKNKLKVELGLCQGKKLYDKRQTIKERDIKRHEYLEY